jgi:hypothetical protein
MSFTAPSAQSTGKSDFSVNENDLPALAPVISNRSQRAAEVDRYAVQQLMPKSPATGIADNQEALAMKNSFTKRRPSMMRQDTSNTLISQFRSGAGEDLELDSKGADAEESTAHVYPPTATTSAAASGVNLPRLSFHQNSSTPELSEAQRKLFRRREWLYLATVTWAMTLEGWNDGTIGPLMPVIQRDFGIGFSIAALLFVSNFFVSTILWLIDNSTTNATVQGFLAGAILNAILNERLGFGKVRVLPMKPL